MTVWVLHMPMTLEEEQHIQERTHLELPFGDMPDMSLVNSQHECKQLLKIRYPDEAPESLALKCDRLWSQFSNLHIEDVIALPLPLTNKIVLAEITGIYTYQVGADGRDVHLIPVRWYPKQYRVQAFGRNRHVFADMGNKLYTIEDPAIRRSVTDKLPYRYNRFARWRWILGIFFVLGMIRMLTTMLAR